MLFLLSPSPAKAQAIMERLKIVEKLCYDSKEHMDDFFREHSLADTAKLFCLSGKVCAEEE